MVDRARHYPEAICSAFLDCAACCACVMVGWYERRFQEILRSFLTALMIGSLIFCIFWPDLARTGDTVSLEGACTD